MGKIYETKNVWAAIVGLTIFIAILPIWLNGNISITDHPNHMARFYIMSHMDTSENLSQIYKLRPGFYPYWGMFSIIKIFEPLVGLDNAGKVFLSLSLSTPIIGTMLLSKAVLGRVTPVSMMAASLTYSATFAWGFANFHLALGMSLMLFSLWIAMGERLGIFKVLLFTILSVLLLCVHMISVALLGLLIGFWHLYPIFKSRKIMWPDVKHYALIALVFLPSFILILILPRDDLGNVSNEFGLEERLGVILAPFMFQHALMVMFLSIAILVAIIYFRDKQVFKPNPRLMFVAAGIAILAIFIPITLMNVAYLHIRLPLLVALVFLAGWSFHSHKHSHIALIILAGLFVTRIGLINHDFHKDDLKIKELRQSFSTLPKGVNILPVIDMKQSRKVDIWNHIKHLHSTSYSIVDAHAFYPIMFPMYEVGYTKEYDRLSVPQGFPLFAKSWIDKPSQTYGRNWQANYDYIVYYHFGADMKLPDYTDVFDRGEWFSIIKNNHPSRQQ